MAFWKDRDKETEKKQKKKQPVEGPEKPVSFLAEPDEDFWGEAKERGVLRRFSRDKEPVRPQVPEAVPAETPEVPVVPLSAPETIEAPLVPPLIPEKVEEPIAPPPPLEEPATVETAERKDFTFEGDVKKAEAEAKMEATAKTEALAVETPTAHEKEERRRREMPVALQMPDEYDGMVTEAPSYWKAVLWGLLAGAIGAGAYAGMAWWRHREYGIIGWLIGIAVGLVVVFASGRHFNWKLGLIAAGISMFFLSAGRILVYMLDVWFPDIIKLPITTVDNFHHALTQFVKQLPTMWLVFLLITGGVAFLISFRPWPIRFQTVGTPEAAAGQKPTEWR